MSYFFDGVDDIMSDGTNGGTDLNIDTYSMMAWVKVDDSVLLTGGHVMGRATGAHVDNHMVSRIIGDSTPEDMHRQASTGGGRSGGQLEVASKPHTLDGTAWDVMVATFSTGRADRWEGYMNGTQYGTYIADDGNPLDYQTAHQYTLGGIYDNTTRYFAGYMGHVAVWSRLLTAQEITSLSGGGNPLNVASTGLIRYWPLTTSSATQVDQAGSGHDLNVTGATYSADEPAVDPVVTAPVLSTTGKTATTVDLSWTDGGTWDEYQIERDGVVIDTIPGLTYTDTGLSPDTAYDYRVRGARAVV